MYRWFCVFHVSELWRACSKFPWCVEGFSSLFIWVWPFCPSFLAAWRTFTCRLTWEFSTSDFQITELPVSWYWADSFSFIVILRIDSRSQTWWGSFSLVLAAHHQIHKSCFCCWWAIVRGRVLSSFRHGTNHNALSNPGEKTFEMATRKHRETHCMQPTNTGGDSTHLLRNFLESECQRAGFWCLHIRFALWFPKWSYRTTNQAQLCGFWTRVSSWDS